MEKRIKAGEKEKKIAKTVIKEVFGITPTNDEDDNIQNSFKIHAVTLKKELEELEKDYYSKSNKYPGEKTIKQGKYLLLDMAHIKTSTEFFEQIVKYELKFLDFADEYEQVSKFFKGEQLDIWERALKLIGIYDDSKIFVEDPGIEEMANKIKNILKQENPYNNIRLLPSLIEDLRNQYGVLLDKELAPIKNDIQEASQRIKEEIEGKLCKDLLSAKIYQLFEDITKKADNCSNIATLQSIKSEVEALKMKLLREIQTKEEKLQEQSIKTTQAGNQNKTIVANIPLPKKQRAIGIKTLTQKNTWKIEKEEDIDIYLKELRKTILEQIKENEILSVEF